MRKQITFQATTILLFLILTSFAGNASAQFPRSSELLKGAKEAANWLDSLAVKDPVSGAVKWPLSLEYPNYFTTGLDRGAAGIGTFFLRLWDITGEPQYLEQAAGSAIFISERYDRGDFFGPDWLAGAASTGTFGLELYRRTGNKSHLKLAKRAASQLLKTARSDDGGFYWDFTSTTNIYVGIPHGAAGIGVFLLDLYSETVDAELLKYAEGAYLWADRYSVDLPSGAKGFKRLTTDIEIYVLWSGSTGMITFQNALWKATGNRRYLNELERTANSLLEHAVPRKKGIAWPYVPGGFPLPTPYFHGAASTIEALLIAYEATTIDEFRKAAKNGARWLMSIKRIGGPKAFFWPHVQGWAQFDTGLGVGTASIGDAFVRVHKVTPKRAYLEHALGAARHLFNVSERIAPGQRCWINYTNPEDPEYSVKEHSTGWSNGAAGIGIFLLNLYEESAGQRNGRRKSAIP